jgi:hypothetical protein
MNELTVNAFWDEEAGEWVASSDDVPGLLSRRANSQTSYRRRPVSSDIQSMPLLVELDSVYWIQSRTRNDGIHSIFWPDQ